MKKLIAVPLSIITIACLMATSLAFAEPNDTLDYGDRLGVFNQLLDSYSPQTQNEIRNSYSGKPDDYLAFKSIKLTKNRQVFLVTGNGEPFVGANKSDCWLYEKESDLRMRKILDFGLCDNVSVGKGKHNGYSDVVDTMIIGYKQERCVRVFQFDGYQYREKPQRRK